MADAPCVEVIEQGENGLGTQIKSRPLAWWQAVVLVAVAGSAVGALSFIAQNRLTDVWGAIANSGTPWLVAAFVIGALMPSNGWAAAAGLCMLPGDLAWLLPGSRQDRSRGHDVPHRRILGRYRAHRWPNIRHNGALVARRTTLAA
jgi:hypothetical protein